MTAICFRGIRGGVGVTSVAAMLGEALRGLGESVLLIDLNYSDMLRLHFNVPYTDSYGWAAARSAGRPWQDQAYLLEENLWLMPYGVQGLTPEADKRALMDESDDFWCDVLPALQQAFSWVLFDLPAGGAMHSGLREQVEHDILVAALDAGCHVHLTRAQVIHSTRILANFHDATQQLSNDLLLDWRRRYGRLMLPVLLHRDQAVNAALAGKTTVLRQFPDSTAAHDARALAALLMAYRGLRP